MSKQRARQSNMELLRIVAMLMIVAHHMVRYANPSLDTYPVSVRWVYFFALESLGEVGVDVFLIISLWFLTARPLAMRTVRTHLLKTEAIMLFYSIPLFFVAKSTLGSDVPEYFALRSLFPLVSGLWWYMTAYALVLLFLPFLVRGLRALGQRMHAQLAYLATVCFGALPMVTFARIPLDALRSFMCLAVVVTYLRWYGLGRWNRRRVGRTLLCVSFVLSVGFGVLVRLDPSSIINNDPMRWSWSPSSLFVMGESIGLFLVFQSLHIQSRVVNALARSTVGVYLIHEHPGVKVLLWHDLAPFADVFGSPLWLPLSLAVTGGVFCVCLGIDLVRRLVFHCVERIRG